ncbi:ABC transporter substrate-binding protein [Pseudalkalibacillus caeni]
MIFTAGCSSNSASNNSGNAGSSDDGGSDGKEVVKIGVLASLTGALESYGKQTQKGFELGLDYATDGTMEVGGKKIEFVFEDTETKPDTAVQKATSPIAIVDALKKTDGDASADALIEAMEGMSFETPKGTMTFREEDHQALQTMYAIKLEKKEGFDYPVPVLLKELSPEDTAPPVQN